VPAAGRTGGRGAAGAAGGRGAITGRAVVCGASGADDGRFSSMRSLNVGGTKRPAGCAGRGGAAAPGEAARVSGGGSAPDGSTDGGGTISEAGTSVWATSTGALTASDAG
jgi:hypothetical protein